MTSRRALLAGAASILAAPLAAKAQPARKLPRIEYLCTNPCGGPPYQAFVDSLEALGYVNARTVTLVYPGYAPTEPSTIDHLPEVAAELVRQKVDLIFAAGDVFAARAAKQVTSTIPIVMAVSGHPVKLGLVSSLARPRGNLTGVTYIEDELVGKQMELLKEVVPTLSRVGVLMDSADTPSIAHLDKVATSLRLRLELVQVRAPTNFEEEFAILGRGGARAIVIVSSPYLYFQGSRIAALALRRRLVAVASFREFAVRNRGLLAFGPKPQDMFRRAASLVDKILKGARPEDLPVEPPTRFELVVNLLAANDRIRFWRRTAHGQRRGISPSAGRRASAGEGFGTSGSS